MKRLFLLVVTTTLFLYNIKSQNIVPCVTDEIHQQILEQHPELKMQEQLANETARRFVPQLNKAATIRYIPVVFHVIHGYGTENISQAQINDQLRILNEDFRKKPEQMAEQVQAVWPPIWNTSLGWRNTTQMENLPMG